MKFRRAVCLEVVIAVIVPRQLCGVGIAVNIRRSSATIEDITIDVGYAATDVDRLQLIAPREKKIFYLIVIIIIL